MCRKLFSPNFEIGSHFLKEDFKIPMNNASVFSCYGHFLHARFGKYA